MNPKNHDRDMIVQCIQLLKSTAHQHHLDFYEANIFCDVDKCVDKCDDDFMEIKTMDTKGTISRALFFQKMGLLSFFSTTGDIWTVGLGFDQSLLEPPNDSDADYRNFLDELTGTAASRGPLREFLHEKGLKNLYSVEAHTPDSETDAREKPIGRLGWIARDRNGEANWPWYIHAPIEQDGMKVSPVYRRHYLHWGRGDRRPFHFWLTRMEWVAADDP